MASEKGSVLSVLESALPEVENLSIEAFASTSSDAVAATSVVAVKFVLIPKSNSDAWNASRWP
jgi:hypothetical protein